MAVFHPQPRATSSERPVYSSHRRLRKSKDPSGRLDHTIVGITSIMVRCLSSALFIPQKCGVLCPPYGRSSPVKPRRTLGFQFIPDPGDPEIATVNNIRTDPRSEHRCRLGALSSY